MALAVALALLAPASVSGQKAVWTMDSCMQYAVTHASDVQRQRIVTRQNEQNYRRAIADFLPSVGASPLSTPSARHVSPSSLRRRHSRRWPMTLPPK